MLRGFAKLLKQRPAVYGTLYLVFVPLFAGLYMSFPGAEISCQSGKCGWLQAGYYSVVTITTLGYGDILPRNSTTQVLASLEALSGVILIGLFLNSVSYRLADEAQQAEKAKEEDRRFAENVARLRSHNTFVELCLNRYLLYTFELTTPLAERGAAREKFKGEIHAVKDFPFSAMRDLFESTLLMSDRHAKPVVEYYFQVQDDLVNAIHDLIVNVDLQRWTDLQDMSLEFIATCRQFDYREHILEQPGIKLNDKTGAQFAAEMIAKHTGPIEFRRSNIMNAYVALYYLVRANLDFVERYRLRVRSIINER